MPQYYTEATTDNYLKYHMEIKTIFILSGKAGPDFEECCSPESSFPDLAEVTVVTNKGCGVPSISKNPHLTHNM